MGYSSQIDQLEGDLVKWNGSLDDTHQKHEVLVQYQDSHFTYKGVMEQIRRFMTDQPTSDLRCQQHPQCPNFAECDCPVVTSGLQPLPVQQPHEQTTSFLAWLAASF